MSSVTQARLREVLRYDPETGVFVWLVAPNGRIVVGQVAGTINDKGYVVIQVDGELQGAHRWAFLWMTGTRPVEVDHRDEMGPKTDNRWSNLRAATKTENQQNQRLSSNSSTGFRGVAFHKATGRYAAYVTHSKKRRHLGLFDTPDDADEFASLARAMLMPFSPDARAYE